MKLKQKIHDKKIILKYYVTHLSEARAYVELLDAINEVQKFGECACFYNYPDTLIICSRFKQEYVCGSQTCPLAKINKAYIEAQKKFSDARVAHYQAETAMKSVKVKE